MRSTAKLVCLVLLVSTIGACAPQGPRDEYAGLARPESLAQVNLEYYWRVSLELQAGESIQRICRLDENVYALTSFNRLFAVDAATGNLRWTYAVADASAPVFGPVNADNVSVSEKPSSIANLLDLQQVKRMPAFDAVMVNTNDTLIVLDRITGRQVRRIHLGFPANTRGVCDSRAFYVGSARTGVHCVLLQEALEAWYFPTDGLLIAPVEYFNSTVYAADMDRNVYAFSPETKSGEKLWTARVGGGVTAGMCVNDQGVFVPCDDYRLYAFDAQTGRALWEPIIFRGPLNEPVAGTRATVFAVASADKLYAVTPDSGQIRWSLPGGRAVVSAMDGDVFVVDAAGTLHQMDEMQGNEKAKVSLGQMDLYARNLTAPAVFAASRDGRIFCIRKINADPLTDDALRTNRRILVREIPIQPPPQ